MTAAWDKLAVKTFKINNSGTPERKNSFQLCSGKLILYRSCGEPSLLVQCTPYEFVTGVIHVIKIANRRTLLEVLLAAISSKHKHGTFIKMSEGVLVKLRLLRTLPLPS